MSPRKLIVPYESRPDYPSLGTVAGRDGMVRVYTAKSSIGGGLKLTITRNLDNKAAHGWSGEAPVTLTREQGLAFAIAIVNAIALMDENGNQKEPA